MATKGIFIRDSLQIILLSEIVAVEILLLDRDILYQMHILSNMVFIFKLDWKT